MNHAAKLENSPIMKKILFVFAIFSLVLVSCGETKKEEVKKKENTTPPAKRNTEREVAGTYLQATSNRPLGQAILFDRR